MNITVDKQPECIAALTAEVPADKVASERTSITSQYTAQAKIPGFRPGKAPAKVIQKRYSKEIEGELENRLFRVACDEAIKQHELRVIDILVPSEKSFTDEGAFRFKCDVLLAPEFELPEYKGIEVLVESEEVTDEDLENGLKQLAERHADFVEIDDRPIKMGDVAVLTYSSTLDGKALEEAIGRNAGHIGGREGFWVKVEDDAFVPGFAEQLVGLSVGDTKEITVTMPDDFPISELQGKDVCFATSVDSIKEMTIPELDDELAAKVAEGKTMEEVKQLLRQNISNDKKRHVNDMKVQQIIGYLGKDLDFALPQALVDSETQNAVNQMAQRGMQQGMTEEQLKGQEEQMIESAGNQARNNLKTNFILRAIAEKEGIEINEQDMTQRIVMMAQQRNEDPQKFVKQLQKDNAIPAVQNQVLIGKTIDFLLSEANIKQVAPEELPQDDE